MATPWQVLDLTGYKGFISVSRGSLKIGEAIVPVADIGTILLGDQCSWGFGLAEKASRYEIPVLVCDWKMTPVACLNGWSDNSRVAARQRAQSNLSEPRRKQAWQRIIKQKISHQADVLELFDSPVERRLRRLMQDVRSGDSKNAEAQAASAYWRALFDDGFRRDPVFDDITNGALNYGYTILRGAVIREVCAAGLWPTLGVFHRQRDNTFALADDLIEPFRPVVDLFVREQSESLFQIDKETRAGLVGLLSQKFLEDGTTVNGAVRSFAQSFALYVEGDHEKLEVPKWKR